MVEVPLRCRARRAADAQGSSESTPVRSTRKSSGSRHSEPADDSDPVPGGVCSLQMHHSLPGGNGNGRSPGHHHRRLIENCFCCVFSTFIPEHHARLLH
ncbi:uncharacterized protein LOC129716328 isoform X2 [Leucoraja erinacea]|uniref:uncharacterized protein LOC129716328 isoform X2 n=1 Tax=Leucoraja erinaceus TaxID=7782 RepID=UPI002455CD7F|nr:uncharacterized protein LOC129716328 isoform X2 [Leucoraja erinacea]